jgi:ABC-2 type transport system ATP-binding protein
VEEIENLLSDVMFINDGRIVLDSNMDDLPELYVELTTSGDNADTARRLSPIYERDVFGQKVLTFEGVSRDKLTGLGELRTPDIADLFVAKVKGVGS